jgi:autotransporter-associated beta strand protein
MRNTRKLTARLWTALAAPVVVAAAADVLHAQLPAFPEAEGFGASVTGGRGGAVYHVTNLNDSGPGSFRDAVSQPNRIVVFDVGGYINLASQVNVQANITIAGQTAPGQGIATRNHSVSFKSADNTIVRNMRFRMGTTGGGDATWADGTSGLIFDHVTSQWGLDETMSITGCSNVTIQNSIIAEGLLTHSMGSLIEWNTISMHHNLYMSNNSRNPKTKGVNDFVNNVVYNWGTEPYIAGDSAGISEANVVNNYFVRGPSSGADPDPFSRGNANYRLYLAGNYYDSNKNGVLDGTLVTPAGIDDPMTYVPTRFDYPDIRTDSAQVAYAKIVAGVGASLVRDSVDQRLIAELTTGGGKVITDPLLETPGFGTITGGVAPTDTDQDGMPDTWETARGLNPANAADRNNVGATGYTRVEEYINDLMTATNAKRVWSASSGTWSTGANWTGGLPDTDVDAFVRGPTASSNGNVTIASGTASAFRLYIGQNGAAAGERVTVSAGGTLDVPYLIQVGYQNAGTLDVAGGTVNAWAIAIGNTLNGTYNGTLNFSGGTIRAGRIDVGGTGSFNWSGGTLKALGNELTITPNLALTGSAGTFDTEAAATITASGVISGPLGITKQGGGSLKLLNTANTYAGPTVINGGGTLVVASIANGGTASSLGAAPTAASNLVLNGGVTLQFAGGGTSNRGMTIDAGGATIRTDAGVIFTLAGPMTFSGTGDRTITVDLAGTSSNISTLGGAIGDPSSGKTSLVKNGLARLSLNGTPKTYSGDTTINAGSVLAFNTNVLPFGAGKGDVLINAGASLDVRNNVSLNGLNGAGSVINGGGGSRTVTLGNGDAAGSFSGPINGPLSIVKVGSGKQVFAGTSTYAGTTTISAGILQFDQATSIGGTGTSVTVSAGAVAAAGYAIDRAFLQRVAPTSAGVVALAANSANALDFSPTGAGLTNASLGAVGNFSFTGTLTPASTTYRLGGGTGTLTLPNAAALTGLRDVVVIAGGAVAPTGLNDYVGTTTVQQGGILMASAFGNGGLPSSVGVASSAASNLILDGGTLHVTATNSSNRGVTVTAAGATIRTSSTAAVNFNGDVVASGAGDRTLTFDLLGNTSWSNAGFGDPSSGRLSLVKTGAGRLGLQGPTRTYSGDTVVTGGTLMPYVNNVLPYGPGRGNLTLGAGTSMDVRATTNINGLNGSGAISNTIGNARTITLGNGDASGTFSGVISTGITIVKAGAGTQVLNGTSTYTGSTIVSGGTLQLGPLATQPVLGGPSVAAPAGADIRGGQLVFDYAGAASVAATIYAVLDAGYDVGFASGRLRSTTLLPGQGLGYVDDAANARFTIRPTWYGDANLDGTVNFDDLLGLAANYNTVTGAGWAGGDFNYDGSINFDDLLALAANYNRSLPSAAGAGFSLADGTVTATPVPEPSCLAWAGALSALVGRRRQRRATKLCPRR